MHAGTVEIEEVVVLPFAAVESLMKYILLMVETGLQIELASKILSFVLRLHFKAIVATMRQRTLSHRFALSSEKG